MNKVILPKEVAEAIQHFENSHKLDFPFQAIMKVAMENERYISDPDHCDIIKAYVFESVDNLKTLMSALVNGYEVETTPEDKVRYLYENNGQKPHVTAWENSENIRVYKRGITDTLDAYGIKIDGVNT